MNPKKLKDFAGERFSQQDRVLSLWQELAENFYPERANFRLTHNIGEELADNLASSQPILIRRELANSFEGMLRDGEWFELTTAGDEPDHEGKLWLEWASNRLRRMMNDRAANFRRATKECDNDYVTFGQGVMSIELNRKQQGLLFRTWHMKDTCWWDNEQGQVDGVIRCWNAKLYEAANYFGKDKLHSSWQTALEKEPFKQVKIYHFDITSELYGDSEYNRFPRVSCWLDVHNEHCIEKGGSNGPLYIVPRFQTIAGSPYAYSPATVVGLPDARTLQAMTHTLLEAGERLARPPIIATENVIRGDANLYPDGVTFVSEDYDERLGASLRPLQQDAKGFPFGVDMQQNIIEVLQSAFYINKIGLPETTHEMTAYEVSERMKQYRRENLPLFAPIEHEYSGRMCETAFELAMGRGFLGSHEDIPDSLKGQSVEFKFQSPLSAADEEKKTNQFQQVAAMLAEAAAIDPAVINNVDFDEALRDAVQGTGAPEKWLREVEEAQAKTEQQQQAQMMAMAQEGVAA